MNPWLLAALVFGGIGLVLKAGEEKESGKTPAIESKPDEKPPKKKAKTKTPPVIDSGEAAGDGELE